MNALIEYFNASLAELHQVRWPTRQQAVRLSVIVLIFCAVSAVFFGLIDFVLSEGISALLKAAS